MTIPSKTEFIAKNWEGENRWRRSELENFANELNLDLYKEDTNQVIFEKILIEINENENFITTIKKKTPNFKKQVDKITYKLNKIKLNTEINKSIPFNKLLEMVKIGPIIKFKTMPKFEKLNKVIEEPEPKINYHLQLVHFDHYYSPTDNGYNMSWKFGNDCTLIFKRHTSNNVKDKWFLKSFNIDKMRYDISIIYNVEQFINDHINEFKFYIENDKITNNIIKQLQLILGNNYLTSYEIGWCLSIDKNIFLKVVIDRFNINNIQVTFNNDVIVHNNVTLMKFINDNLDKITKFKQEIVEFNLNKQILLKEKREQHFVQLKIEKELHKLQLDEKLKEYNNTIKQKKGNNLFVNRSKKELIETITCKPYIEH
jgi:hypothetical protein